MSEIVYEKLFCGPITALLVAVPPHIPDDVCSGSSGHRRQLAVGGRAPCSWAAHDAFHARSQSRAKVVSSFHTLLIVLTTALGMVFPAASVEAQTKAEAHEQARVHFQRGKTAFESGKFEVALWEYEKAYELAPLPGFLFNIGQCHRNLDHHQKAISFFRLYLSKKPNASNRRAVEALINELQEKVEANDEPPITNPMTKTNKEKNKTLGVKPKETPNPVVFSLPTPIARRTVGTTPFYKKWWFWTSVAVAVGGGAAGVYFAARAAGPNLPSSDFPVLDIRR